MLDDATQILTFGWW